MHPLQDTQGVAMVCAVYHGTLLLLPVGEKDWKLLAFNAGCGEDVAQGPRWFDGSVGLSPCLTSLLDFRLSGVGNSTESR
jgi:hypothetical protein